ncbi:MAG: rod shape-determining protein MreD [Rhodobacterales bacterium 12-65-15]|nr:MAG: rod shape-determining protein MreD [Rhodobacterales bacterium 12-65-15]
MDEVWWRAPWAYRALFLGLAFLILFFRLLPLGQTPGSLPGPDLLLCLIMAWMVRRPEFLPLPIILVVILIEDFLLMRPPGLWTALMVVATEFLRSRVALTRELNFPVEWMLISGIMLGLMVAYRLILAVTFVPQPGFGVVLVQTLWSIVIYPAVVLASQVALNLYKPAMGEVDKAGKRL